MAKEFLSNENVPFKEFDVTKDADALKEMTTASGARSVPVITCCGEVMVGFDKEKLGSMISCKN